MNCLNKMIPLLWLRRSLGATSEAILQIDGVSRILVAHAPWRNQFYGSKIIGLPKRPSRRFGRHDKSLRWHSFHTGCRSGKYDSPHNSGLNKRGDDR